MNVPPANVQPKAGDTWEKVEWNAIKDGGTYVIAMTKPDGNSWLLPSATSTNAAPKITDAAKVTIVDDTTELTADQADYGWTFTQSGSGFKISNSAGSYLFSNDTNNGVRIGAKEGIWTLSTGTHLGMDTPKTRYLGIYMEQDWRAYANTTGNTAGQQVSFWHLKNELIAPETKVKTPTATPGTGSTVALGATVTLSCTTQDVTYHTNTDGTNWTPLLGNTFTIPSSASGTYEVKVKATKDGLTESDVLDLTYHIFDSASVKDIAEARRGDAGTSIAPGDIFAVSGVVTYKSGSNYYIQDDTAGIVLYDNSLNLDRGQKVTVSGGLADYNGLLELVKVTVFGTEPGTLPTPKAVAIAGINDDVQAQLIKITGAKVKAVSGKTVTLSEGEGDAEIGRAHV